MKFAIIGCGVIAKIHAQVLQSIEEAEIYAAYDIIEKKADEFAKVWNIPHVYYDASQVMNNPEVDVVCVCVPSGTHGEICIAAAKAGKAIICEKPMEITPERIEEVTKVVRENNVKMQCIFQRRLMPVAIAARKAIEEGKLGKICTAHANLKYYRDQAYYDSAGWRGTWNQDGGGALMNQGVHGVDLILWLVGGKMKTLYGKAKTLARDIQVEDTAAALIQMENGALITIDSATTAYPGYETTFEIHGEKGSIVFNDDEIKTWAFIDEKNAPAVPEKGEAVGGGKSNVDIGNYGHYELFCDLISAIKEDRPCLIPPEDAKTAVQVICGIYESEKTGQVLAMN